MASVAVKSLEHFHFLVVDVTQVGKGDIAPAPVFCKALRHGVCEMELSILRSGNCPIRQMGICVPIFKNQAALC